LLIYKVNIVFRLLEKYWPFISIGLFAFLLASLFFWPEHSRLVALTILILGAGIAIALNISRYVQAYRQAWLENNSLARNILLDLLGLLLTIGAASYLGAMAGRWASNYGLWTGLATGMIVGFVGALGVKTLWGRIMRIIQA
jgi:hypothetical protein